MELTGEDGGGDDEVEELGLAGAGRGACDFDDGWRLPGVCCRWWWCEWCIWIVGVRVVLRALSWLRGVQKDI